MRRKRLLGAAVILVMALVASSATYAVKAYYSNKDLTAKSDEFIAGYVAGAADLLAALEDADYIVANHRRDVQRAIQCSTVTLNDVSKLVAAWRDHYKQGRIKDNDSAGPSVYLALRQKC